MARSSGRAYAAVRAAGSNGDDTTPGGDGPNAVAPPPVVTAVAPVAAPPAAAPTPEAPRPELVFKRHLHPVVMVRELIAARDLVVALTERDFRARYKQTKVGVAWAVLTPLLLLGAFSILANTAAEFDTNGMPYPLFAAVALVPWTFFSNAEIGRAHV